MCDRLTQATSLGDGIEESFLCDSAAEWKNPFFPALKKLKSNQTEDCTSRAAFSRTEARIRSGLINTLLLTASISHHTLHTTMCTMMWIHYFRIKSDEENFFRFSIFPTHTIAHFGCFLLVFSFSHWNVFLLMKSLLIYAWYRNPHSDSMLLPHCSW